MRVKQINSKDSCDFNLTDLYKFLRNKYNLYVSETTYTPTDINSFTIKMVDLDGDFSIEFRGDSPEDLKKRITKRLKCKPAKRTTIEVKHGLYK